MNEYISAKRDSYHAEEDWLIFEDVLLLFPILFVKSFKHTFSSEWVMSWAILKAALPTLRD
jgi:hypothetical protein